eukprot:TRINITY_DN6720_c0_g1_i1.p1 TRINITY_DN6720_c0_g1~~TRINITY_DN6720_c0_g1_i1.p1  ORF type:complete len:495 (-),score=145.34 TRINITY_DN6720_c0_g1_i1:9-1493(-)
MSVLLDTSLGEIVIDLHCKECPSATKNFLKLCKIKYYNNCLFFNVQKDFTVQTGDPTGTGKGGDSIFGLLYGDQARYFADEIRPSLKHNKIGTVAMSNSDKDLNASQFYITTKEDLEYLDGKHTVFGQVAEGLDVLDQINKIYTDSNGRPLMNIRIKHTYILDDPYPDPPSLLIPPSSPILVKSEFDLLRPEQGEQIDEYEGMSKEEVDEILAKKDEKAHATILEMIGDISSADEKPPENVLFVCKLHPVTEDADLNLIFSRFGKIKSCEIIRDFKTGESLCYAFIEYSTPQECELAYLKMDNVLIDDRRIHVDFSQSVAKNRQYSQSFTNFSRGGKGNHHHQDGRIEPHTQLKSSSKNNNNGYDMVFATPQRTSLNHDTHNRDRDRSDHHHHPHHRSSSDRGGNRDREDDRRGDRHHHHQRSSDRDDDRRDNRSRDADKRDRDTRDNRDNRDNRDDRDDRDRRRREGEEGADHRDKRRRTEDHHSSSRDKDRR